MIASYLPDFAMADAATGISNAPGTQAAVIFSSSTPWRTSPSTAPPKSLFTMISLKREATIPTFMPSGATTFPSNTLISFMMILLFLCFLLFRSLHNYMQNSISNCPALPPVRDACRRCAGLSILSHFNFCKDMSHLVLLCLQIEAVVLLRIDLDRHALMDLKSEAGKSVDLLRIVREKS